MNTTTILTIGAACIACVLAVGALSTSTVPDIPVKRPPGAHRAIGLDSPTVDVPPPVSYPLYARRTLDPQWRDRFTDFQATGKFGDPWR
jgi:hypothetical protein